MLDDISSELDEKNLRLVLETIDSLSIQCICSVVEKSTIQKYQKTYNNFKMFHVKQGMITED